MKVVSFTICPFVQRVTALLEAKGLHHADGAYELEFIKLSEKPQWFLKASPNGQVPILFTEDERVLFESDAICEYLEDTSDPALFNEDPVLKAQERAWSYLATKHYLVQCGAQSSKDHATLDERSAKLGKAFAKFEAVLGDTPFFAGDTPGMVDIA